MDIFPEKKDIIEKIQAYIEENRDVLKSKKFSTLFMQFLENNFLEKMSGEKNDGVECFRFLYSMEKEFS